MREAHPLYNILSYSLLLLLPVYGFLFLSRSRRITLKYCDIYSTTSTSVLSCFICYMIETFSRILIIFLVNKTVFSTMSYIFSSKIRVHIQYECIRVIRPRAFSVIWCIYTNYWSWFGSRFYWACYTFFGFESARSARIVI